MPVPEPTPTVEQIDHRGKTSHNVYTAGFYDDDWDLAVRLVLGKATRGGADIGEVLVTISEVEPGDHEGWYTAWLALGDRVAAIAATSAARGHRVSAARAYLRAANYYAVAVNGLSAVEGTERLLPTFRRHREMWDGFLSSIDWPVERLDIPYEDSSLPGWIFRPAAQRTRRPTLVMNLGSDEAISGLWGQGVSGGLERGYNVVVFEGPGQQSMLFERGLFFRADWERVLTPVVDHLLLRDDVDPDRLAAYGVSQAGYWVPRALAFEHRFAAAIVDGGVTDVAQSWARYIPHVLLASYHRGDKDRFDKEMSLALHLPGRQTGRQRWNFRARPYGATGYSATLDAVERFTLRDLARRIATPLYVIDTDGDQFFSGQPAELASLAPRATLARFTQAEGASHHCQPLARELTEQRMFDWLDEQLA